MRIYLVCDHLQQRRSVLLDCRIFDHNTKLERLLVISAAKNSTPEQSTRVDFTGISKKYLKNRSD
jgi:hypothetical protein